MRTNNSKIKNIIISIYFVLIITAIFSAVMFKTFSDISNDPFIVFFVIALLFGAIFFLIHYISKFFEYDSDGQKVIITNKELLLSDRFSNKEHIAEFEKHDLIGFKFHNFFVFNSLVVLIRDRNGHTKKERFNVTFVAKKKRRYIRQSLTKIIKENKKQEVS
jgi:uncharacterized integral membrane protein